MPRVRAELPLCVAVLALGACGGDTGGTNPPPPPPPPGPPVLTTVTVTPSNPTVFMGDTLQLTATATDQHGGVVSGKTVTWSTDAPTVATVDANGQVVALTAGTVRITATVETKSGSVLLTSTGPALGGGAPGSAVVGATGGSVAATLPGGGALNLSVPAGALADPVTITLEPAVPGPGALAAFKIFPAGLVLGEPATLVIRVSTGAKVRPTTTLVFDDGAGSIPAPSTPNPGAGTITVKLTSLGLAPAPAPGQTALRAGSLPKAASGSGSSGSVLNLSISQLVASANAALQLLQTQGTVASAIAMQTAMDAVVTLDPTAARSGLMSNTIFGWTTAVCNSTGFARNAFNNFGFISDYQGLARVTGDYLGWTLAMGVMRTFQAQFAFSPSCSNPLPNAQTEIQNKFQGLQAPITADLNAFAVSPSPQDSAFFKDRIGPLLSLSASLRLAAFDPAALILETILTAQVDRVRLAGYGACVTGTGSQAIQSRLIRALSTHGTLSAVASFDEFDLEEDVELCGMNVRWRLKDSVAAVVATGSLGMSTLGVVHATDAGTLGGNGILEIDGGGGRLLRALQCPAPASANNEQLEFLAGPDAFTLTRVAILSPSNADDYLAVSALQISTASLRSAAGLGANAPGTVVVVIRRIGGVCSGMFANLAHSVIGILTVTLDDPCPGPSGPSFAASSGKANVCAGRTIVGTVSVQTAAQLAALSDVVKVQGILVVFDNGSDPITTLEPLARLQEVTTVISISSLPRVTSLSGLRNLRTVNDFAISGMPKLTGLDGLDNLRAVPGTLTLSSLPLVTTLQGLNQLTSIGNLLGVNLPLLTSLGGLSQATITKGVQFQGGMTALTSLAGPAFAPALLGDVRLANNPLLTNLGGLRNVTSLNGSLVLVNNPGVVLSDLAGVTVVEANLQITGSTITSVASLGIKRIGGELLVSLTGLPLVTNFTLPALTEFRRTLPPQQGLTTGMLIDLASCNTTSRAPMTISLPLVTSMPVGWRFLDPNVRPLGCLVDLNLPSLVSAPAGFGLTRVRTLNLGPVVSTQGAGFSDRTDLVDAAHPMTSLSLSGISSGQGPMGVAGLPNLQSLTITGLTAGDLHFSSLPKLTSLTITGHISDEIQFFDIPGLSDAQMVAIGASVGARAVWRISAAGTVKLFPIP